MLLKPVLGFMLALAVMVGMVFLSMPRDEQPGDASPTSRACDADRQKVLLSRARSGLPLEVTPALFSEEPLGIRGYCSYDCSGCSSTADCRANGAGVCMNICP